MKLLYLNIILIILFILYLSYILYSIISKNDTYLPLYISSGFSIIVFIYVIIYINFISKNNKVYVDKMFENNYLTSSSYKNLSNPSSVISASEN